MVFNLPNYQHNPSTIECLLCKLNPLNGFPDLMQLINYLWQRSGSEAAGSVIQSNAYLKYLFLAYGLGAH